MPLTPTPPLHRRLARATGLVLALALGGLAWGQSPDRDQPMNVEADTLRYDDARQTSVFSGNVVLTKGSILIRGQQIEVRQDPQGNQFGLVVGQPAQQAYFRQRRGTLDEHIEGVADRIEYNSQADTVKFLGRAVLRRYRGAQLNDETAGALIVYNNLTDVFTVDGAASQPTSGNPSGRVRAMLTPVPKDGAAAPAVPAPVPGTAPVLQPSQGMGEGRK